MSTLLDIANAIVAELASDHAFLSFAPEFDLKSLAARQIAVVPAGTEISMLSRFENEETHHISIGIMQRAGSDDASNFIRDVTILGQSFLKKEYGGGICIEVKFDPLYSQDHLREKNLFASVISLAFRSFS